MLVARLIVECVTNEHHNLELLCRCVKNRAQYSGITPGDGEIRVVLESLIKKRLVGVFQYLAEDDCYAAIEYLPQYAYFYWFGPPGSEQRGLQSCP